MCDNYQDEYISEFHEEFMRHYIEEELRRSERASNTFLNRTPRVTHGRPATSQELASHLASLSPYEDEFGEDA